MSKELTIKQKKRLEKIATVIQDGELAIAEMIFDIEDRIDEEMPALHNLIARLKGDKGDNYVISDKDIKEIATQAQRLIDLHTVAVTAAGFIKVPVKEISLEVAKIVGKPQDGKTPTRKELIEIIRPLIPEPIPGEDGLDADENLILYRLEQRMPMLGMAIRDALEMLDGKERLHISNIDGVEEMIEDIKSGQVVRIGGGTRGLFFYIDGVKKGILNTINLKAGTGMSIAHSKVNGLDTFTFNSSGGGGSNGVSVETPVEVPNGVITVFTVSAEPKWIVVDGITLYAGAGYSYAALAVTVDLAPTASIRVIVGGASSVTVETPPESPDGVITAFTVTAEPQWVVADGITYYDGAGYTYAALTVTMTVPPSTTIRVII